MAHERRGTGGIAAQRKIALVQNGQQDDLIGLAAAELEALGIALAVGLVPA